MAKKPSKAKRIKRILTDASEIEEKVIDLIGAGYTPREVTHRVNVTLPRVTTIMDSFLADYASNLSEKAESVYYVSMHRLDTMYSRLAPHAYPSGDPTVFPDENGDFPEGHIPYYEGNPALLNIMLKTLKEIREWHKMQVKSHDDSNSINIDHVDVTITTKNPLYVQALESEQEDWMRLADTPVEDLYLDPPQAKAVEDKVEERLEALAKATGVNFDDD